MADTNVQEHINELITFLAGPDACHFRGQHTTAQWDCDNTNKHAVRWMQAHHIETLPIPKHWCDCEIVLNGSQLLEGDNEDFYQETMGNNWMISTGNMPVGKE